VRACVFAPTGALVASGGRDKTVLVWNSSTGDIVHELRGHRDAVTALAFGHAGSNLLASTSADFTARVWQLRASGAVCTAVLRGHASAVVACQFARLPMPPGSLGKQSDNDTNDINNNNSNNNDSGGSNIEMSRLATAGSDGRVILWNTSTAERVTSMEAHGGDRVTGCAFANDGAHVVSSADDGYVRLWEALPGSLVASLAGHSAGVSGVAFAGPASPASVSPDGTLRLWSTGSAAAMSAGTGTGTSSSSSSATTSSSASSAARGSSSKAASASSSSCSSSSASAAAVNAAAGPMMHKFPVSAVAATPDGIFAVSGDTSGYANLWCASTGARLAVWRCAETAGATAITSIAATALASSSLSSSSKSAAARASTTAAEVLVATGDAGGEVALWTLRVRRGLASVVACTQVHAAVNPLARGAAATVSLSRDGRRILAGWWSGEVVAARVSLARTITDLVVLKGPDAAPALSASSETGTETEEEPSRQLNAHSDWVSCSAFGTKDGRLAATASRDGVVAVWDLDAEPALVVASKLAIPHPEPVCRAARALAFDPRDPSMLAVTLGDGSVRILSVRTGLGIALVRVQPPAVAGGESVRHAVVLADGSLAACSGDRVVVVTPGGGVAAELPLSTAPTCFGAAGGMRPMVVSGDGTGGVSIARLVVESSPQAVSATAGAAGR
jgi:WD40 repeat protein